MLLMLVVAHALFTGTPSSEVAGNLSFALLLVCFPLSVIGYPLALAAVSFLEPAGLLPYNSRLALTVWWGVFFFVGTLQWFLLPWLWHKLRPNNALNTDAPKDGAPVS